MSAIDGQISVKCRATLIMRHLLGGRMRVCGLGSAGLFVNGGQLRFVHVPIRIMAGAGRSPLARAAWVRSPDARFWYGQAPPLGAGKTGVRLVYRYIYIPHTLERSTTKQVML